MSSYTEGSSETQLLGGKIRFTDDLDPLLEVGSLEMLREEFHRKTVGRGGVGGGWMGGREVGGGGSGGGMGGGGGGAGSVGGGGGGLGGGGWEEKGYFRGRGGKFYDFGFEEKIEKGCKGYMAKEDEEDRFSESDSDGDGPPDVPVNFKI